MSARLSLADLAVTLAILTGAYVFIYLPVVTLVLFSFHDGRLPVPPFRGPTLQWYETVLSDRRMVAALLRSVLVGLVASAIACVAGFLAAYALARHAMRGAALLRSFLMLPLAVSYVVVGMGLLIIVNALGIGPSLPIVTLGHAAVILPVAFAIFASQLGEHQRRLELAARDLGASRMQAMRLVTLPVLLPAFMAAFALCFTLSWDEFVIAFLLSRFDVTLPVVIFGQLRAGINPITNAAGTIVFLISLIGLLFVEIALIKGRRR